MLKSRIKYRFALVSLLILVVFNFLPLALLAALVPPGEGGDGPDSYKWPQLVQLFNNVTDFIFLDLMIPLAVIAIVWAGIQVLRGKTQPEELIKAKGALANVAIGIFMALGAYVIVKTILDLLVDSESGPIQQAIQQVFGS